MPRFTNIRRWLGTHQKLKQALIPVWNVSMGIAWSLRSFVASHRPISMEVGNRRLKIWPEGQIAQALWTYQFEARERSFLEAYICPGMTFVNAGANIGAYALLAAELVGLNGKVYAFEPSRESFDRLARNVSLNGYRCVTAENFALAERSKMVALFDVAEPVLDAHRYVVPLDEASSKAAREVMRATSLDEYFSNREVNVDVLLIDVEGAEYYVLQGARDILRQHPTILVECTNNIPEVKALLTDYGYGFWRWSVEERSLVPASFEETARVGNVIARTSSWRAP